MWITLKSNILTVTNVINSSSNIRNSQNISFSSKCQILFDMYCDGLHKMVYKAIACEKSFINKMLLKKHLKVKFDVYK